ncbi:unnamed protein product [Blepharisma stoltei]|uniref:Uncharacterized protein n=1 Tax=Blepharisma stoltei TaxID=1481888 RepID=A0AAU9JJ59_9CILI|nr:unnamed protein product [Blepharisma stoltei]
MGNYTCLTYRDENEKFITESFQEMQRPSISPASNKNFHATMIKSLKTEIQISKLEIVHLQSVLRGYLDRKITQIISRTKPIKAQNSWDSPLLKHFFPPSLPILPDLF